MTLAFDFEQLLGEGVARRWVKLKTGEAPVHNRLEKQLVERLGDVHGWRAEQVWAVYGVHGDSDVWPDGVQWRRMQLDAERSAADTIMLHGVLPWVHNVPELLRQAAACLRPDGVLLGWALGEETLREWHGAWAAVGGQDSRRVGPFGTVQQAGAALRQAGLALPVVDRDVLTVTYPTFAALVRGLRAEGGILWRPDRPRGLVTPRLWRRVAEAYRAQNPRDDGRWPVTLEILWLHGVKPGETTPQAAKRGSGQMGLGSALRVKIEEI